MRDTNYDIWGKIFKVDNINFNPEAFYQPEQDDFLYPNYPNPFNSSTKIAYQILAYHKVRLAIYDVLGREVRVLVNEPQEKGIYEVTFNASGLSSGIYFCRFEGFRTSTRKILLVK